MTVGTIGSGGLRRPIRRSHIRENDELIHGVVVWIRAGSRCATRGSQDHVRPWLLSVQSVSSAPPVMVVVVGVAMAMVLPMCPGADGPWFSLFAGGFIPEASIFSDMS